VILTQYGRCVKIAAGSRKGHRAPPLRVKRLVCFEGKRRLRAILFMTGGVPHFPGVATFGTKEGYLLPQSQGKAAQGTIGADDPVAGDNSGKGIYLQGLPHSSNGTGTARLFRYPFIAPRLSIRNSLRHLPNLSLKGSIF
jgi:hypothetical protein